MISKSLTDDILRGDTVSLKASLIKGDLSDAIYFFTNNLLHWIPNPNIFNLCQFNRKRVVLINQDIVNLLPKGKKSAHYLT